MNSIKTITIIGANGAMGKNIAGIFGSFGNAKVYMVSREKEKAEKAAEDASYSVKAQSIINNLIPVTYEDLYKCVSESDLIFESGSERLDVKHELHNTISRYINELGEKAKNKIICTGTSGFSVTNIAELYPMFIRKNIMGMHFFNPPYQMILCEMIPTKYTMEDTSIFENLCDYCSRILKRTVAVVKDTPAFLGNRIGFFFINEALILSEKYKEQGGIDYIDSIFSGYTGRSMGPIKTADFVGLDVHKAIVDNIKSNTCDQFNDSFVNPDYVENLIRKNLLGRKTHCGLFKTLTDESGRKNFEIYDIQNKEYRKMKKYTFDFMLIVKLSEGIIV